VLRLACFPTASVQPYFSIDVTLASLRDSAFRRIDFDRLRVGLLEKRGCRAGTSEDRGPDLCNGSV